MSVRRLMILLKIRCHLGKKKNTKRDHVVIKLERKQLCHYNENLSDNTCKKCQITQFSADWKV